MPYAWSVSQRRSIALNVASLPRISRIASIVAGARRYMPSPSNRSAGRAGSAGGTRQEIGYWALAYTSRYWSRGGIGKNVPVDDHTHAEKTAMPSLSQTSRQRAGVTRLPKN